MSNLRKAVDDFPALYLFGFLFLYFRSLFSALSIISIPDFIDKIVFFAGIFFLCTYIAMKAYIYTKEKVLCCFVILIGLLTYLFSEQTAAFTFCVLIAASYCVRDIRYVIKIWTFTSIICLSIILVLYGIVYLTDFSLIKIFRRSETDSYARYSLFFVSPNMASAFITFIILAVLFLHFSNINFIDYGLSFLLLYIAYLITDSKTSFFLGIVGVLLLAIDKKICFAKRKILYTLTLISPLIQYLLSFFFSTVLYDEKLNQVLTGRLALWRHAFEVYGIKLFGNPFSAMKEKNQQGYVLYFTTIDSFYVQSICIFGIVFCLFFLYLYFNTVSLHPHDGSLPLLLVISLFGFSEVHVLNIFICFPILILSKGLFKPDQHVAAIGDSQSKIV